MKLSITSLPFQVSISDCGTFLWFFFAMLTSISIATALENQWIQPQNRKLINKLANPSHQFWTRTYCRMTITNAHVNDPYSLRYECTQQPPALLYSCLRWILPFVKKTLWQSHLILKTRLTHISSHGITIICKSSSRHKHRQTIDHSYVFPWFKTGSF